MAKTILKTRQEVEDFVRGATLYGVGGGGAYSIGVDLLMEQLEAGKEIGWIDVEDIADDDYTLCPFGMGSLSPLTKEKKELMQVIGLEGEGMNRGHSLAAAARALEKFTGKSTVAYIPFEVGGRQSASCVAAAAVNGKLALDGDYAGRAVPAIFQTTAYIYEKNMMPLSACDAWGNISYVEHAVNWRMAERIGKMISVAAFTGTAMAGFLMNGKDTKEILLRGTMTLALEAGKCIREAREAGKNVPAMCAEQVGGWVLGSGVITKKSWWDKDGYYWGYYDIKGDGAYKGDTFKISFQNENHILEKNDKVWVTSPDMIMIVNTDSGEPYHNDEVEEGAKITIIGAKAIEAFRTQRGMDVLGPKNFGVDADYVPIEEAVK